MPPSYAEYCSWRTKCDPASTSDAVRRCERLGDKSAAAALALLELAVRLLSPSEPDPPYTQITDLTEELAAEAKREDTKANAR